MSPAPPTHARTYACSTRAKLGSFLAAFAVISIGLATSSCSAFPSSAKTIEVDGNAWTIHGELRMAGTTRPDNLNPLLGTQVIDTELSMFWGSYLFLLDDHTRIVPELATAVPTKENGGVSDDGRTITYHLRQGVLWQDGVPFTADDVVYSWEQVMNPRNDAGSREGYELIRRIDEPDSYTVVVHLRQPWSPFVATFFSMSSDPYCIFPKHILDKYPDLNDVPYNRLPIGTGPFKVVASAGDVVRMVANPLYWRGAPKLREIDYRIYPSDQSILDAVRAHKVDFYANAAQALEPQLHQIRGSTVYLYPFTRWTDIGFNLSRPQLSDVRVRQALAYATDRNELITHVTHGVNLPADGDQPPFFWAHDNDLKKYPYDPRLAAAMLDQAGWRMGPDGVRRKGGRELKLSMVGFTGSQTVIEAEQWIKNEWSQVGVKLTIRNFPSDKLYAPVADGGIEQLGEFDVAFEDWANGTDPDDSQIFLCKLRPPAGWNIYHYCNPELDAAEHAALTDYQVARRKVDYDRVQEILTTDLPIYVIWFQQRQDVVNIDLKNYRPATAVTPYWNPWEWDI
jgi:peptide/nickel transport system substrate-binding protein